MIAQLAQQIAEMRVEMHKTRELANLAIISNTPPKKNERNPFHFHSYNPTPEHFPHNQPTVPVQKPPIVELNTTDQYHTSSSYQIPHPSQNLNFNYSQASLHVPNFSSKHFKPTYYSTPTSKSHFPYSNPYITTTSINYLSPSQSL